MYKFRIKLKEESEDICGAKMLKMQKKTKKFFLSYDYNLFRDEFFIDISNGYCLFIYLFEKGTLPNLKKVSGPKVYMKEAIEKFLKGREDYFIEEGRVCVYDMRAPSNLKFISKIDLVEFEKLLGRDISFVKSVRRLL